MIKETSKCFFFLLVFEKWNKVKASNVFVIIYDNTNRNKRHVLFLDHQFPKMHQNPCRDYTKVNNFPLFFLIPQWILH